MNKKYLLLAAILATSGAAGYYTLYHGHDWGGDFALYINQARSLVEGRVYECFTDNAWSMRNSTVAVGPDLYPWGFPLLLAPVYYLFGLDIFAMKVFVLAFFLLTLAAIFLLFRKRLGEMTSLLLVAVFAYNPYMLFFNNNVISDIPHLFFSLFAILLMERFVVERKFLAGRSLSLVLLGLFIFYAYYIRSNGVVLLPTLLVCQLVEKRGSLKNGLISYIRENRSDVLPFVAFFVLLALSRLFLIEGSSSFFMKTISAEKVLENAVYYAQVPSVFFGYGYLPVALYAITLPFALFGIVRSFSKSYVYIVYSALTMGILLVFPFQQGLRYFLPVLPFYIYFLFEGLLGASALFASRAGGPGAKAGPIRSRVFLVFALFITGYFLVQTLGNAYPNFRERRYLDGPYSPTSREMFSFVVDKTGAGDAIIFGRPRVMTLYTGRRSLIVSDVSLIVSSPGDYAVIHKKIGRYYQAAPEDFFSRPFRESFELVFENGDYLVFRIRR